MSRQQTLAWLLDNSKLFDLKPIINGDETPRTMYVSADILAVVTPPFPDTREGERLGQFRAWLDDFVDGARISVSEDPRRKPPETMLARVENAEDEFWSIRVTEPANTAGIRSFGAFCALNEFVAVTWGMRDDICDEFDEAVTEAQERWKDLFGVEGPHSGVNLDEYLTNYYRAV
jgi:hypothetical protein